MTPEHPDSDEPAQPTPEQERLLTKYLAFYRDLETGRRKPTTPAQEHFVAFTTGHIPAETDHERAYAVHMRLRAYQRELARQDRGSRDPDDGPTDEWFTREDWKKLRRRH